ncbi:protein TONNEAU 1b isoform X2 [Brassica napus]|uniref:protein TONNEAU 1b isoform X2 n=1 Tax=Brassica napus TaxID=3708 RepID=UPI00207AFBBE|nr:protein TONNEAU 1b isoform X2 [Brassica napus]
MDDYTREMMDLKTLVTRTLEKKGVLAKIRAELRASVFEAIEEEDRVIQNSQGLPPALLGNCNDRARRLHASPSGRLLSALVCEYLDWAQLNHTLKVYQPECNLAKDSWKSELRDFSSNSGYELNRNGGSKPLLLDVLDGFFKFEAIGGGGGSRRESETESSSSLDSRNPPRRSSASDSLPPQRRSVSASQASGPTFGYIKEEHSWRYESEDGTEEVTRASAALENLQLDRKTRNLTSSWSRNVRDGTSEEAGKDKHGSLM